MKIEYSLVSRGPETAIFPTLEALGIAATAYGVFSRGLLTGSIPKDARDFRAHLPRFSGENGERNRSLVQRLARFAADKAVKPSHLAIAWVRAKAEAQNISVIPTIGARNPAQLDDAMAALSVSLTPEEVAVLEATLPASEVAGTRYAASQMAMLDSER